MLNKGVEIMRSLHPKYGPKFTFFSTLELCGIDEENKSTSSHSKGRSREFFVYFFAEKK
jgi:hypothetical protein